MDIDVRGGGGRLRWLAVRFAEAHRSRVHRRAGYERSGPRRGQPARRGHARRRTAAPPPPSDRTPLNTRRTPLWPHPSANSSIASRVAAAAAPAAPSNAPIAELCRRAPPRRCPCARSARAHSRNCLLLMLISSPTYCISNAAVGQPNPQAKRRDNWPAVLAERMRTNLANAPQSVAQDSSGRLLIAGYFEGTNIGGTCTGILRVIPDQLFADGLEAAPATPTCPP